MDVFLALTVGVAIDLPIDLPSVLDRSTVTMIAAIVVGILTVKLLVRLFSVGAGTLFTIIAIVLVLQYGFGISPRQLWVETSHLPQDLVRLAQSLT
jgi:hypothetical protein